MPKRSFEDRTLLDRASDLLAPKTQKFPVNSLFNREFIAESSSHQTASSKQPVYPIHDSPQKAGLCGLVDALLAAQLSDAVLAAQTRNHDPDLFLIRLRTSREILGRPPRQRPRDLTAAELCVCRPLGFGARLSQDSKWKSRVNESDVTEMKALVPPVLCRRVLIVSGRDLDWYGVHMVRGLKSLAERMARVRAAVL